MSRELAEANPGNVELRVAVALALLGRGDAYVQFATRSSTRGQDLVWAVRDYSEAVGILERLEQEKAIEGTDGETLEKAREGAEENPGAGSQG